jgi:hypothetical protein
MKHPHVSLLCAALLAVLLIPTHAQSQVSASAVTYEGFRNVRTNGNNSTYGQALTHRYVNGELRFLTIAHPGILHEFSISTTAFGGTITQTTGTWDLGPTKSLNNFNGIWFEQAKNRLWVTSAQDYTTTNHPAKITLISLGAGGVATTIKQFFLNVPAKRVYGGCNAVPSALVAQLGGPYVCGWGGYTSLVAQGGGASIGATMYAIPDPDTIASGATASARTILDHAATRGVRKTLPDNYFDGGDGRQNPSSRPTTAPLSTAAWLSPNAEGLGWMTWGDSYYNTGVWIGTTYASVASLCQGGCWYQSSTLAFDGRQFELHLWNGNTLGSNAQARPSSMAELQFPRGNTRVWSGNSATGNIAGATYDAVTGRLYLIGFPFGTDDYTGRLYTYAISGAGGAPAPAPGDTTAPSVALTSPAGGSVSGTVTLGATATDNVAVSGVWFTVDGTTVGSEDTTAPYQLAWNTASVASGTHTLRALARDAAGNIAVSATVSVTVGNTSGDTTPPAVGVTSPAASATVSGIVTVSAAASDNVGVTSVQFTLNGVNLGAADTTAPYTINWNTAGAVNGTHALRAMARDAAGNVTLSTTRLVAVANSTSSSSSCSTPDPFIALGGGSCSNGSWLPPDMPDSDSQPAPAPAPAPTAPSSTSTSCATVQPGANWTCYQGSWFPPSMVPQMSGGATGGTTGPTPAPAPALPPSTCPSSKPAWDWVCLAGGWLPPTHPLALAYLQGGVQPPAPPALPETSEPVYAPGVCTTAVPGVGWVCVGGGWVPPTHPLALARGETY